MPPRLGAKNRPTGFLALSSWENKFFQLGIFLQNSIRNENRIIILNNVPLHYDIWLTDLRGLSTDKICRASFSETYIISDVGKGVIAQVRNRKFNIELQFFGR